MFRHFIRSEPHGIFSPTNLNQSQGIPAAAQGRQFALAAPRAKPKWPLG
jgi:hypothetical protein